MSAFAILRSSSVHLGLCASICAASSVPARAGSTPEVPATNPSLNHTSTQPMCPTTMRLETTNGSDFSAVFRSKTSEVIAVKMRLFADNTDYVVSMPNVAIGTPYRDVAHDLSYRSQPVTIHVPGDVPIAAAVDATAKASNVQCATEDVYIEPSGSVYKLKELEARASSQADIDAEANGMTTSVLALPAPVSSFPCRIPFLRPVLADVQQPSLPDDSIGNEQGVVFLSVALDNASNVTGVAIIKSSGSETLDASAREAAEYSKFRTEIFACKPLASHYIFRSTFAAER